MLRSLGLRLAGAGAGCAGLWALSRDEPAQLAAAPAPARRSSSIVTPAFGYPLSEHVFHKSGFTVSYDCRTRAPRWVFEHLTVEKLNGTAKRTGLEFKPEPHLPELFRASNKDYAASGFDRGHLVPAADMRFSEDAVADSFLLSNVCPQDPDLNRNYWARIEAFVRGLTKKFANVYVYSGPLYLPRKEGDKNVVSYEVIGDSQVAVPTHFFKVVMVEKTESLDPNVPGSGGPRFMAAALVVPNRPVPTDVPLINFLRPMQFVESAVGVTFFPDIRASIEDGHALGKQQQAHKGKGGAVAAASAPALPPVAALCDHTTCTLPPPGFWGQGGKGGAEAD